MAADDRQVGGSHYIDQPTRPWDVIDTWPIEQRIGFYRGNALKYLMRLGTKDAGAQEAAKAAHYCEKLAETLAGEQPVAVPERQGQAPACLGYLVRNPLDMCDTCAWRFDCANVAFALADGS